MILSILIPTYNRVNDLEKNLNLICSFITEVKNEDQVCLIVSNNKSTDNTKSVVEDIIELYPKIQIKLFNQKDNIGLEKNALFILDKAETKYIMYLGDDDYFEKEYLTTVLKLINNESDIFNIIPSYVPIDLNGRIIKGGRDIGLTSYKYQKGFRNCLENSWRGHQLSGIVLYRPSLYKLYKENKVSNIYPFIFFVAINCLRGSTYHLTDYPLKITQPGQDKKDWNYGKDGLLSEVFDNYIKLNVLNIFQITLLQIRFLSRQSWRLWNYKDMGVNKFIRAIMELYKSKKATFLFKLILPFFLIFSTISRKLR